MVVLIKEGGSAVQMGALVCSERVNQSVQAGKTVCKYNLTTWKLYLLHEIAFYKSCNYSWAQSSIWHVIRCTWLRSDAWSYTVTLLPYVFIVHNINIECTKQCKRRKKNIRTINLVSILHYPFGNALSRKENHIWQTFLASQKSCFVK